MTQLAVACKIVPLEVWLFERAGEESLVSGGGAPIGYSSASALSGSAVSHRFG
jgi:hypothetical protein